MNTATISVLKVKESVRARDGFTCTKCGMGKEEHIEQYGRNLDVHRVVPGSEYTVEGCVTLCVRCHSNEPKSPWGTVVDSHRIEIQATEQWIADLDAAAEAVGLSRSAYIRLACNRLIDSDRRAKNTPPTEESE